MTNKNELNAEMIRLYQQTAEQLFGREKRIFMARVVAIYGKGGQRWAEKELNWNRGTIRRGQLELENGEISTSHGQRGKKRVDDFLPKLNDDLRSIVREHYFDNPSFWKDKVIEMSVAQMIKILIVDKGYGRDELPSPETIRRKILKMGYNLRKN